jgi:hypothetical protein
MHHDAVADTEGAGVNVLTQSGYDATRLVAGDDWIALLEVALSSVLQSARDSRPRPTTCAWISAAPSKMFRMRASHSTRLISNSRA